jgi:hypothetical protein
MAYTEADIAALKAILASGAGTVKHGDKTVIYRSREEILAALGDALAEVSPSTRRPRTSFASHNRG